MQTGRLSRVLRLLGGVLVAFVLVFLPMGQTRDHVVAAPAEVAVQPAEQVQAAAITINSTINGQWFPRSTVFYNDTSEEMFFYVEGGGEKDYGSSGWIAPYSSRSYLPTGSLRVIKYFCIRRWDQTEEIAHFGVGG